MTQASICTIGDEILIGQIVDTNSSHISQALNALGVKVTRMLSISDAHDEIVNSLDRELAANDIVIVTGGLGPTKDDITKPALACLSGTTHRPGAPGVPPLYRVHRWDAPQQWECRLSQPLPAESSALP